MTELIFPAAVVFSGYVVLGMTGFGSALVIVPLLTWHWPLTEVVPLVLLLDAPATALLGGLNLQRVNVTEIRRLLPGLLVGSLAGLWLAGALEPRWPLFALGVYVAFVGSGAFRLRSQAQRLAPSYWAHGAGFAMGLVEMMFGTSGPLVVAWLKRRLPDVDDLRASTPLVLLIGVVTVLGVMGFSGRLSGQSLWLRWIGLAGVAVVGVLLGHRLSKHVSPGIMKRTVDVLLVISGLSLTRHVWL